MHHRKSSHLDISLSLYVYCHPFFFGFHFSSFVCILYYCFVFLFYKILCYVRSVNVQCKKNLDFFEYV